MKTRKKKIDDETHKKFQEIGRLGGVRSAKNLGKTGRKARAKLAAAARWAKAKKGAKSK